MANKNISKAKKNGIYYTPDELAKFLVKPLIQKSHLSIFDPAYGEGSLLLAAEAILKQKDATGNKNLHIYGCDTTPVNGYLKHLPSSHLLKLDFFEYPLEHKFDVILMNPPYVRHHLISYSKIKRYQKIVARSCQLKLSSDLWAYFLVKSISHLKEGGSIGAILPWSFLQADYASGIRKWLSNHFGEIRVLALGADFFDKAQERILMVWLQHYGEPLRAIDISFSQHISDNLVYTKLDKAKWELQNVLFSRTYDIEMILTNYINHYNFKKFEEYADVKIGVVTGADNFFIMSEREAKKVGFLKRHLVPIFTSSKEFSGFSLNGNDPAGRLILLSPRYYGAYKSYIRGGIKENYHLRAHSTRREPWYSVELGQTPDAFFPYRATLLPYLVVNDRGVQCTNSIHRVYFRDLSSTEKKWLQISLMAVPGQLSVEAYSKTYGGGVLKIEPKSLKNAIVYKSDDQAIDMVYSKISNLVSAGKRFEAMQCATDFINRKLRIPAKLSKIASSALIELQNRRLIR